MTSPAPSASPSPNELVARFFKNVLRHVKGRWAGQPFPLEPWQRRDIIDPLYGTLDAAGKRVYKEGLFGIARKNGKSQLAAGLALYHLTAGGEPGGEIYSLAGSRDQARVVFNLARMMVEGSPLLAKRLRVFRSAIEDPQSGSVYRVLSSDAKMAHGHNPNFAVVDELHVHPNAELYEAMRTAMGARAEPLLVSITTAGHDKESICWRLYDKGRLGEDPRLLFRWWESPQGADPDDPLAWRAANPASWITDEFLAEQRGSAGLHETTFRQLHMNQWTETLAAWLPFGAWDACGSGRRLQPGEEVVLGFDGSYRGDSTALVACTADGFLEVVGVWERPPGGSDDWRVDIGGVEDAIREACRRWQVREVACDPYRWARSMQLLAGEGLPMVEWPTNSPARMVPACARFYDAVMDRRLSHDGDGRLSRHVANCVIKTDRLGPRIVKDHTHSVRRIDLAVAAVIAFERATAQAASAVSVYEERDFLIL